MAEAEVALITFLWASFVLPAMVVTFASAAHHLFGVLEANDPVQRSQRRLLRRANRYQPRLRKHRVPPDRRRKEHRLPPNRIPPDRGRIPIRFYLSPSHWWHLGIYFAFSIGFKLLMKVERFLKRWNVKFFDSTKFQAFPASNSNRGGPTTCQFDSDSVRIGLDNHASRTLSPNIHHFEDLQLREGGNVRGLGDKPGEGAAIAGIGTFVFTIQDDTGQWHVIKLPNSLYVPSAEGVLVSPQHWAQEAKDDHPKAYGTVMITGAKESIMLWSQQQFKATIPHDPRTNTPIFYSQPGSRIFNAFSAEFVACDAYHAPIEETIRLPPDMARQREAEGDMFGPEENIHMINQVRLPPDKDQVRLPPDKVPPDKDTRQVPLTFDPGGDLVSSSDQGSYFSGPVSDEPQAKDKSSELLRWHYRLGHMSFAKLKHLAKLGQIPRYLANVAAPKCAACLFGAMTKVPWRSRPKAGNESNIYIATKPGEVVLVDQMTSTLPGFVAQITGKLTKRRYVGATVFVDHFSRLKFVYLMESMTSENTVRAKEAFERFARDHGVSVQHYHADNGRFKDNAFVTHCHSCGQRLSFCGVNAHFQNGIAEKAIRDLTESARKMLLFAKSRWPDAVDMSIWPYALRQAAYNDSIVPNDDNGLSKLDRFGTLRVNANLKSMHTFGCPVYVLDERLATNKSVPRWDSRA